MCLGMDHVAVVLVTGHSPVRRSARSQSMDRILLSDSALMYSRNGPLVTFGELKVDSDPGRAKVLAMSSSTLLAPAKRVRTNHLFLPAALCTAISMGSQKYADNAVPGSNPSTP